MPPKSSPVRKRSMLTFLEADFTFYVEISVLKSDLVPNGLGQHLPTEND